MPASLGMVPKATAPFYHEHEKLSREFRERHSTVPMPFPIRTSSGTATLFNLARFRRRDLVEHFLAFSQRNVPYIGNLDQSLLNFFRKRIMRLDDCRNRPPYRADCLDTAHIVHFHGPKPWEISKPWPGTKCASTASLKCGAAGMSCSPKRSASPPIPGIEPGTSPAGGEIFSARAMKKSLFPEIPKG